MSTSGRPPSSRPPSGGNSRPPFSGPRPHGSNSGAGRPAGSSGGSRPPFQRPSGPRPSGPRPPYQGVDRGNPRPQRPSDDTTRINENIRAAEIRLIDADGEMIGVVPVSKGIEMAQEAGLDLVEISPNAEPPVCKVLDYGKYKYEQQKKANEARKKQKTVDTKEIKLRPAIGQHDFDVKLRHANEFLEEGHKVKVSMRFRGREMANVQAGKDVFNRFKEGLLQNGKVEMEPRLEGMQMMMYVVSTKGK
ncbi:MAG: translation initiation factor IF-3 [Alphaproteobacteria bacterium]|nr:translation initiation factor IF-3 [Alphaproteobacteria bacterium]